MTTAIANVESNANVSRRYPTTVALDVVRPVDVQVHTLVHGTVNGSWFVAHFAVESEVPSLPTVGAACYAKVTHVYHSQVGICS